MHFVSAFVLLALSLAANAVEDPASDVKSIAVPVTASVKVADDTAVPNDAPEASRAATFQVSNDLQQRVSRQLAQQPPVPAPPAGAAPASAGLVQNSPQGGTITVPPPPFQGALSPPQPVNPEQAPGVPRFYFRIGQPDIAPQILIGNPPVPPPLFTVLGNGSAGHGSPFLFNGATGEPARFIQQNVQIPAGLGIAPHQIQQNPGNGASPVSGAGVGTGGSFLVGSPNGARTIIGTPERGVALVGNPGGPTQALTYGAGAPRATYAQPVSTVPIQVPGQVAPQAPVYANPALPAQPQYAVPAQPQYTVPAQPSLYQQPVYYQQPLVASHPVHYSPYAAQIPQGQVPYVPSPYFG